VCCHCLGLQAGHPEVRHLDIILNKAKPSEKSTAKQNSNSFRNYFCRKIFESLFKKEYFIRIQKCFSNNEKVTFTFLSMYYLAKINSGLYIPKHREKINIFS
jgi:hypothetical protein